MSYSDSRIVVVVAAVRASYGRMTQQEAADLISVSKSHFRSLFFRNVGMGFQEYSMEVKMDRVKELLADSRRGIEEVAGDVGYQARSALENLFRKKTGIRPAQYRETIT
jgi:two-component system response regulator YesN